ncbi:WYL domain-containing protein [Streptomyces hirsutus]|uniref:WYL domain-containing protein n=1 Tax=Streptomyces hirsutus TaxID=35620 RepID=UPI0033DCCF28
MAGTWYLVADQAGRPRLFRVGRFRGIAVTTEPVRRRDGAELVEVWEELGRKVESRAGGGAVRARVRRHRLDMPRRIARPHFLGWSGRTRRMRRN